MCWAIKLYYGMYLDGEYEFIAKKSCYETYQSMDYIIFWKIKNYYRVEIYHRFTILQNLALEKILRADFRLNAKIVLPKDLIYVTLPFESVPYSHLIWFITLKPQNIFATSIDGKHKLISVTNSQTW